MAEPIRLGLVLEGEDARVFEENMRNPKVTEEQRAFFREAIRVYDAHRSEFMRSAPMHHSSERD
ncbi:MAG: hypothetical protein GWP10_21635 [Nitrospiraceae bacterium]|nr:hypothetical protein [Nitrospiraceae bacterium]